MSAPTTDPAPPEAEPDGEERSLAQRLAARTGPDGLLGRLDALGGNLVAKPGRTLGLLALALGLFAVVLSDISLGRIVVDGAQAGAVYALIALGLALVYSSTRVLNFAQGEFGTVPAFVVLSILLGGDLLQTVDPADVSAVRLGALTLLAVLVGAALAIAVNLLVIQRLADSSPVTSLVATAGIALLLVGAQFVTFEAQARRFPRFRDGAPCLESRVDEEGVLQCVRFLEAFGFRISWHTIVIAGVLAVVAVLLAALLRTPIGVALVASAQEPYAASLHGVSPRAMSSLAWGLAGALGGLSGVLGAGVFERLTPGLMTSTFLIPGFTAAVLGGLTSMTGAVVGGLLLGIAASFATTVVSVNELSSIIPSAPDFAAFVVLLVVLLVRPNGLFGKG